MKYDSTHDLFQPPNKNIKMKTTTNTLNNKKKRKEKSNNKGLSFNDSIQM